MHSLALNTEVAFGLYGRHHENSILRHNSSGDRLIETKFGTLMQNHMPMTTLRWKLKQEIEFQYGERPFSQTGSSFISTVDWDISSKFGMHIDFHHFERMHSLNLNSEVDFRLYDRRLEKSIWRHNSSGDLMIERKFGMLIQNHMPMTTHRSKLKHEIEFQYGDRPFSQTGSSFISTVDWDISSKFGMHIDFHHFERMDSLNSEVDFRLYDRHLEKSIWRQKSADVCPITTKFCRRMQHDMRIITHTL